MRRITLVVSLIVAYVLLATGLSQAAPLNLDVNYPWVYSSSIFIDYKVAGKEFTSANEEYGTFTTNFTAEGWTMQVKIDEESSPVTLWEGIFELTAVINSAGEESSGTLYVTGDYPGPATVSLFESTMLIDFGFVKEDKFEFVFIQQGESSLPGVTPGCTIGVIINGRAIDKFNDIDPYFTEDFSGDWLAKADAFLPEPATIALLAAGILGVMRHRRR